MGASRRLEHSRPPRSVILLGLRDFGLTLTRLVRLRSREVGVVAALARHYYLRAGGG